MCLTLFLKNTSWIHPLFGVYGGVIHYMCWFSYWSIDSIFCTKEGPKILWKLAWSLKNCCGVQCFDLAGLLFSQGIILLYYPLYYIYYPIYIYWLKIIILISCSFFWRTKWCCLRMLKRNEHGLPLSGPAKKLCCFLSSFSTWLAIPQQWEDAPDFFSLYHMWLTKLDSWRWTR